MDIVCCFFGFYLYAQVAVIFNSWKLLMWDDPRWKRFHRKNNPDSRKTFALAWLVITPLVMFLDVGFLFTGVRLMTGTEWVRYIGGIPILAIMLASTYTKTQFIHMCWITWRVERLKEHLNKKN